jgi:hypothetical protein
MTRVRPAALVFAAAIAAVCAACSGSSTATAPSPGSASVAASVAPAAATLTAAQVSSAVNDAAQQASAVHVRGTVAEQGSTVQFDLQLNKDSASGTIEKDSVAAPVLRIGDTYYVRFTSSLMNQAGIAAGSPAGKMLKDKWLSSTSQIGAKMAADFKKLLDYTSFVQNTLGKLKSSSLTEGGTDTVDGTPVLVFPSSDGTAYVTAAEPHYLLRMKDGQNGAVDFTDWNKPSPVSAPPADQIYSGPGA